MSADNQYIIDMAKQMGYEDAETYREGRMDMELLDMLTKGLENPHLLPHMRTEHRAALAEFLLGDHPGVAKMQSPGSYEGILAFASGFNTGFALAYDLVMRHGDVLARGQEGSHGAERHDQ